MKKIRISAILSFLLCLCMIFSVFSGCNVAKPDDSNDDPDSGQTDDGDDGEDDEVDPYVTKYIQPTQMPYYAEWLDKNYPRQKDVEVRNEGLAEYPVFGSAFKSKNAPERAAVYSENMKLTSGDTAFWGNTASETPAGWPFYNMIDKDGNLLKINFSTASSPADAVDSGIDLYKHTASMGMYFGDVSDDEPAVVKRIRLKGKSYGTAVTGLYAPAGEVVKVEMSAASLRERNLYISIGQTSGSGKAHPIPSTTDRSYMHMPITCSRFRMNKKSSYYNAETDTYSCYIGSHLGGPIYVMTTNASSKADTSEFEFTISGAVNYRHYILGVTTEEEFEYTSKSSAPYFDMEVSWMQGVRHSGPLKNAQVYNYEELTNAARYWEKVGLVSNKIPNWCDGGGNIVFLYDSYITKGDAFALTGHRNVTAPYGWMTSALNYKAFSTDGSWGNMHEYNHHYQKFGMSGDSNEITNNAANLLEYALFTGISSKRTLTGTTSKEYWNSFTSPQYGLLNLLNANKKADDGGSARSKHDSLHVYAALLNNIGADAFLASAKWNSSRTGYFNNVCNATHLDMTYFFKEILNFTDDDIGGADALAQLKAKNYPVFVPVNTVYQVGRIWQKDGKDQYARTVQPFVYGTGDYTLDFENYLVIPQGFSYEIKEVTQPENGGVTLDDKLHITYKPNGEKLSGDFIVTIKVTKDDGAFAVDDVRLVINLRQQDDPTLSELYVAPSYLSPAYTYNYNAAYSDGQTLVESRFAKSVNDNPKYTLTESYALSNVFDGDDNNIFWSTGNTMGDESYSEQNPFEITVDLGKTVTANKFTIYYPTASNFANYYCTHFKVYAGETREDMRLVYTAENAERANNATAITLDSPVSLRYYKLVVTDAAKRTDRQFALRKLEWSYSATGGEVISPESKLLTYYENGRQEEEAAINYTGNWSLKTAFCSFGRIKTGDAASTASFTFRGKQLAVFSCLGSEYGSYEIYLDGKIAATVDISQGSGKSLTYISGLLGSGKHTVTIKGKSGTFNLDSLVIFK